MTDNLDKVDDIVKKFRDEILTNPELKALYRKELHKVEKFLGKVSNTETFSWVKFFSGFNFLNPIVLAKWIQSIIIVIITLSIILGGIYYLGYKGGTAHKPINIILSQGKPNQELVIKYPDGKTYLHIYSNGEVWFEDEKGKKLKRVEAKDVVGLNEQLTPYGFQLEPIGVIGVGIGNDGISGEAGVGVSWFRAQKFNLDSFITNMGIYPLGISYKLDDIGLKNSAVGIAGGVGWDTFQGEKDTRVITYFRIKF